MPNIPNSSSAPPIAPRITGTPAAKPKPEEPDRAFYADAHARRVPLVFWMRGGQRITGIVRTFGTFTLNVETLTGRVLIYKHGLDLVEIAGDRPRQNPRTSDAAAQATSGPLRPPAGCAK